MEGRLKRISTSQKVVIICMSVAYAYAIYPSAASRKTSWSQFEIKWTFINTLACASFWYNYNFSLYNFFFINYASKQMISNLIDCGRIQHDSDLLLHMILPIIVIKVIVSCILVPFLLKNLHGHTKLYNFLQQFSTDLYSLTLIVPFILR